MEITLSIIAIILAALAITPYILEIWFWFFRKPKMIATIYERECTYDYNANISDVRFSLGVTLSPGYPTHGYPAIFRNLQLILPMQAEPYKHSSISKIYQEQLYTLEIETRLALILNTSYRPEDCHLTSAHMIAFKIPGKHCSVSLDIIGDVEIDEAYLGFKAIFYHARRHLKTITIKLDLEKPHIMQHEEYID